MIVKTLDLALALRGTPVTVVGGFQSSMEKECLVTLLRGKQPVIVCPARSMEGMRMPSAWRAAIDAGIMLVISPFAARYRRPTEALAAERNRFVVTLADEVIVAHAAPGGQLERLCREVAASGKPLWTLADDGNKNLVAMGAQPLQVKEVTTRFHDTASYRPEGPEKTCAGNGRNKKRTLIWRHIGSG